jgi:pantothenate kinase
MGKIQDSKPKQHYFSLKEELYPYLLVNLRSGATFTRVESKTSYKRIHGNTIGASTFWGMLRILNYYNDPTDSIMGAFRGDSSNIDMSVGDIYGGDYPG